MADLVVAIKAGGRLWAADADLVAFGLLRLSLEVLRGEHLGPSQFPCREAQVAHRIRPPGDHVQESIDGTGPLRRHFNA